ncbi:AraC family transcriptional regulator [[Clostridium] aminophilum]|uniref:AraC family transcriptional regulator n=1 Tax=[Clostridium] aminophilum TaxID=1526 RepID=UPI00331FC804
MQTYEYEIHISRNNTYSMDLPHFHEEIEIMLCTSGEGVFFIEPNTYPLHRGQLFLISSSTLHRSVANDEYRCMVFHILPSVLENISSPQSDFFRDSNYSGLIATLSEEETAEMSGQIAALSRDFGDGFGADIRQMIALYQFLLSFHEKKSHLMLTAEDDGSIHFNSGHLGTVSIHKVISYIQDHLAEPMSLQSVSSDLFMSKYYLSHNFKKATGFSVMEYVIYCRILRARSLLRAGMNVQTVGETVGFASNEHFIRTFKKITHITPKQYAIHYRRVNQEPSRDLLVIEGRNGRIRQKTPS